MLGWIAYIKSLNPKFKHIAGKDNPVADMLSRARYEDEEGLIDESDDVIGRSLCQHAPTTIFTDSQSAMVVARNPLFHARVKHIDIHYHYVKERLHAQEITLNYYPTKDNTIDMFTKALS
ncbi:hypothetical protein L7F22_006507 [Adiantum nelumboides]|nr:hypothetical protein [Adiantum nelumboides]